MCLECGCGKVGEVTIGGVSSKAIGSPLTQATDKAEAEAAVHAHAPTEGQGHSHEQEHSHEHEHGHGGAGHSIPVHQAILAKNDRMAERNRGYFKAKGLLVLNIVSAPGSGKTTLIQMTATALASRWRTGVIVGDLATDNDAVRFRAAGVPVVQITTGTVCHLEAEMVARAMTQLNLDGT
ncbi:MAG: hydrogenase nickel incorporation protein HypB [Verrucomicrobiota bacterium]